VTQEKFWHRLERIKKEKTKINYGKENFRIQSKECIIECLESSPVYYSVNAHLCALRFITL